MKPVGLISAGVLLLLLGAAAPSYAQEQQAKPEKQEQQGKPEKHQPGLGGGVGPHCFPALPPAAQVSR